MTYDCKVSVLIELESFNNTCSCHISEKDNKNNIYESYLVVSQRVAVNLSWSVNLCLAVSGSETSIPLEGEVPVRKKEMKSFFSLSQPLMKLTAFLMDTSNLFLSHFLRLCWMSEIVMNFCIETTGSILLFAKCYPPHIWWCCITWHSKHEFGPLGWNWRIRWLHLCRDLSLLLMNH